MWPSVEYTVYSRYCLANDIDVMSGRYIVY